MSVIDDLLANNERYARSYQGPLPLLPSGHLAVIACMDARLDVFGALGLEGGEAHVIRNAGGVVTDDEIRSLTISQRLLGTTSIILIHHTDCGMLTFTDDQFKAAIQQEVGIKPAWAAEAFSDLDEDVRQSIARIKASPFIPHTDDVRGFVFDIGTGLLREVKLGARARPDRCSRAYPGAGRPGLRPPARPRERPPARPPHRLPFAVVIDRPRTSRGGGD